VTGKPDRVTRSGMTRTIAPFLLAAVCFLSGCGTETDDSDFQPPHAGETAQQVKAQYGDPRSVVQGSDGTVAWVYALGTSKAFIPIYGAFAEYRSLVIHFDAAGRVTRWETATNRLLG
jgi:hypothetical protein